MLSSLTAVVTCHESGSLLKRALDSIASQGPIRIVLVDDGSRRCSCQELASEYENLLHVERPNGGHPAALNTGLLHVETDLVAFLDDDDEWLPDKAVRQVRLLSQSDADAVVGGVVNVREGVDGEVERRYFPTARMLGAVTLRTAAARRVGEFIEQTKHHSIVDWWLRADSEGFTVVDDDQPALLRRIHGKNDGIVNREQARRDLLHHLRSHVLTRKQA